MVVGSDHVGSGRLKWAPASWSSSLVDDPAGDLSIFIILAADSIGRAGGGLREVAGGTLDGVAWVACLAEAKPKMQGAWSRKLREKREQLLQALELASELEALMVHRARDERAQRPSRISRQHLNGALHALPREGEHPLQHARAAKGRRRT